MKKLLAVFCAVALCYNGMAAATAAAASAHDWNPDDTLPSTDEVASAAAHALATHCQTASCKAIIVIHELADIEIFENGEANGMASLYLGNRPRIAGRRLDRLLLRHPELFAPVCAAGAKLLSHVRVGPGIYEMLVPVEVLITGVDMDLRDHGHCTQDLIAALPKDAANDVFRRNANNLCVDGDENHHRPKAACDALTQGLKAEP
ncbi:hypothetical protein [Lichenicoccus sp.]|uniref:hypothetical protein n=1 Tax=Lichenicoccus sp. TaxID=2781899 RepID=UPI003D0F2007